jgi:hypothetical protein
MSKDEANFKFHDAEVKLIKFDKTIKFEFAKVGLNRGIILTIIEIFFRNLLKILVLQ